MNTKVCSKCKVDKNLSDYYKNKSKKDGLCELCKSCLSAIQKEYYQNNREAVIQRTKKYAAKNRDKKLFIS